MKSRLTEMHEENGSLRAHIASLEAARLVGGDQAKHNGKAVVCLNRLLTFTTYSVQVDQVYL